METSPFTLEEIKTLHAKVKSGADFPRFVQDLVQLGMAHYDTFVSDGHTHYVGKSGYRLTSGPKYPEQPVSNQPDIATLTARLKIHQQGGTDYLTFCSEAAQAGVEKWTVRMHEMTCTYYDREGNEMLAETIPQ